MNNNEIMRSVKGFLFFGVVRVITTVADITIASFLVFYYGGMFANHRVIAHEYIVYRGKGHFASFVQAQFDVFCNNFQAMFTTMY